jgi:hypothetical protein
MVTILPTNTSTAWAPPSLGLEATAATHPSPHHYLHMHQRRLQHISAHSTSTAPHHRACTTHRRLMIDRSASTQQSSHALHVTILARDENRRGTVRLKHHMAYRVHITSPCLPYTHTRTQHACNSQRSRYSPQTQARHGLDRLSGSKPQPCRIPAHPTTYTCINAGSHTSPQTVPPKRHAIERAQPTVA